MPKYQLVLRCKSCTHRYKRIVVIDDDEAIEDYPDPPCPKCAKRSERRDAYETATPAIPHDGMDGIIASQRAPGINGASPIVKAIDQTADIVMKDYALSDLKDSVRQGEVMAPQLPPAQQKLADNFFGGTKPSASQNQRQQAKMARMLRRAVNGGYRAGALDVKSVLPDQRVALRRIGTEPINR
jgi:hypothetical protein